jgi:hypothetical protein
MSEMHAHGRIEEAKFFYYVIQSHVRSGISVAFKPSDLRNAFRRISYTGGKIHWNLWENPYIFAVRTLTDFINAQRSEVQSTIVGPDDKIDFIFDNRTFEKSIIVRGWDQIKEGMPAELAALYGASPRFEDDEVYLPLQAADFWAWWIRRWASEYNRAKWGNFPWELGIKDRPFCLSFWLDEDYIVDYLVREVEVDLPEGEKILKTAKLGG